MRRLRVLTWHVHGSYLYYLTQAPHDFYVPVKPGRPEGHGGRNGNFTWGEHVHELPAEELQRHEFDVVLFQSRRNWEVDQYEVPSPAQRRLPRIYLTRRGRRSTHAQIAAPAAGGVPRQGRHPRARRAL